MKRMTCILLIITMLIAISGCFLQAPVDYVGYLELGIPTQSRYLKGIRARCPWDMIIWDEKLYIGSGDYGLNAGPVDIWCYDIQESTWENSGTVPDEEISRFCVVGNALVAPGIDPTEDWSYGNYYKLDADTWVKSRNILGGIHHFDMVEYNGSIFCGLGVASGEYPVVCSVDNGETFKSVPMYKDGVLLDTSTSEKVRVYDLFVLNDTLYAFFRYGDTEITYDLYRYENGIFVYDNPWHEKIDYVVHRNNIMGGKAEFNGYIFFTTGYLYATADMANLTCIRFSNSQVVYDVCVYNNVVYALCAEQKKDGRYIVSVWKNSGKNATDFSEVFQFAYEVPPLSFACDDKGFYFGMGNYSAEHDKNGMVLFVDYGIDE